MKPAQGAARNERSPGLQYRRRQALKGRNNHPMSSPEFYKKSLTQETSSLSDLAHFDPKTADFDHQNTFGKNQNSNTGILERRIF